MKHVKLVATSVIACAAIMAVPGGALAAKHGPQAHATGKAGTANIVRVSGTLVNPTAGAPALTITTKSGTGVTVQLSNATVYVVNGTKSTTAPAFTNGEVVHVVAVKQSDGSLVARTVAVGTAPKANLVRITGTLSNPTAGATSLTITPKSGATVTVQLDSKTVYIVNGQKAQAAPAFTNGEAVRVVAVKAANGTLTARTVAVGTAPRANVVRVAGTLSNPTAGATSLTVTTKTGNVTVQLNSKTVYVVNGQKSAAAPAFTNGEAVRIAATKAADGTLTARVVEVGTAAGKGTHANLVRISGTISNPTAGATSLTITPKSGTAVTVQLTSSTIYLAGHTRSAVAPAFSNGQPVRVIAQKQADGSLVALIVATK